MNKFNFTKNYKYIDQASIKITIGENDYYVIKDNNRYGKSLLRQINYTNYFRYVVIDKFKYKNETGFFVHLNGINRFFVYTKGNPFINCIYRMYGQTRGDITYKYIMAIDGGILGFKDDDHMRNYLQLTLHEDITIDAIIDLYEIHSTHRIKKFKENVPGISKNLYKKRNIFSIFCRKLLKW